MEAPAEEVLNSTADAVVAFTASGLLAAFLIQTDLKLSQFAPETFRCVQGMNPIATLSLVGNHTSVIKTSNPNRVSSLG